MGVEIEFKNSDKTVEWEDRFESILEAAEEHGITIESDCQQGFCGSCKTKLLSGEVHMEATDGLEEEEDEDMILPCVAVPKTDIVLEA